MASENPVSPKVYAAGLGSIALPIILYVVSELLTNLALIEGLPSWAYAIASTIGAVIASYRKTDGLRIPTIDDEAVAKLTPAGVDE